MKNLVSLVLVLLTPVGAFASQCTVGSTSDNINLDSIVIGKNSATIALRSENEDFTQLYQYSFSKTSSADGINNYSGPNFQMTYDTHTKSYDIIAIRPGSGYVIPPVKFELHEVVCEN